MTTLLLAAAVLLLFGAAAVSWIIEIGNDLDRWALAGRDDR